MRRKFSLLFVSVLTFFALIVFDQTQRYFVNSLITAVLPRSKHTTESNVSVKNSVQKFPVDFKFGVSSSAYQIEGGWSEDGRTPCSWDTFIHEHPEKIADKSNADVGADSYHRFEDDIEALNSVGFQHYRFSISWTRILPNGSLVNEKAVDYYQKIIDGLIARGVEPIVTIFHWDLPQWLQDLGGLTNPIFVDYYVAYANILFKTFGDKVKRWVTLNEPYNYCVISYGFGKWAPGIQSPGIGDYLCGHHFLMAQAAVYRLYREKYFDKFGGQVGITLESPYYFPKDESVTAEDHQRAMLYRMGWFAQPLFGAKGGYPQVIIDEIDKRSEVEGRPFSRLPKMSDELRESIRGSADFYGINYYTTSLIEINKAERDPRDPPSWFADSGVKESSDSSWKHAKTVWLYSVPEGLRSLLNWIKNEYNNPPVFITENGWNDDGEIEDNDRIDYFNSHLLAVAKAINEDKCNVIGYTAWSLLDSLEWNSGYTIKYGIFNVNYTSPMRERTPKKSVNFLRKLIRKRSVLEL